ncbi:hypothetical protein GJU40_01005 [Bacillus lacus]|uniref:YxiS n=1 Tax=Metabacillus lacus TaxID=1983721 RepID=A0A7X2LVT4_9BACI|nr:hypothetical protein [Metabacillus lacus]MRX70745.1 hypothetical protein [Metabacillus lacus]
MNSGNLSDHIIQQYEKDEKMMILIFAQWCINQDLDPQKVYSKAYPQQGENSVLKDVMELTVSKEEAGEIDNNVLLGVLSAFGNDDLAFAVTKEIQEGKKKK